MQIIDEILAATSHTREEGTEAAITIQVRIYIIISVQNVVDGNLLNN